MGITSVFFRLGGFIKKSARRILSYESLASGTSMNIPIYFYIILLFCTVSMSFENLLSEKSDLLIVIFSLTLIDSQTISVVFVYSINCMEKWLPLLWTRCM